jgi:hypothetical protein
MSEKDDRTSRLARVANRCVGMRGALAAVAVATLSAVSAHAVITPPGAPATPDDEPSGFCREDFPAGSERPKVTETFPLHGESGHALMLEVVVDHPKGDSLLPGGLGSRSGGDDERTLERAGFFIPNPAGNVAPKLDAQTTGDRTKSHLSLPFVALPPKAGRHELELPSLPISLARASGEVRTLCTKPHTIVIEDPTANTPDAKPKGNLKPIRQNEEWTAAKQAAIGAAAALVVAALAFAAFRWWNKRPKVLPPPPPPRPPWDVALEELFDVRTAELVRDGRYAEHFDRVSDAVRRYLGARYGFDGLETTTHEAMSALRRILPALGALGDVDAFLRDADLVKFAKLVPSEPECYQALSQAEHIVRSTMPAMAGMRDAPMDADRGSTTPKGDRAP